MPWDEGVDDSVEAIRIALLAFAMIVVLLIILATLKNMGSNLAETSSTFTRQVVDIVVSVIVLLGGLGALASFLKAVNDVQWGLGHLITLVFLSPIIIYVAYSITQATSSKADINQLEKATTIVDFSLEINLVLVGVVLGLVLLLTSRLLK